MIDLELCSILGCDISELQGVRGPAKAPGEVGGRSRLPPNRPRRGASHCVGL